MADFSQTTMDMAKALAAKGAEDIILLDVKALTMIADAMIVCSGLAVNHVRLLADHLEESMEKEGVGKIRIEGYREGRWIVLDYGDVLVHIFHKEEREFYNIERLWKGPDNSLVYEVTAE